MVEFLTFFCWSRGGWLEPCLGPSTWRPWRWAASPPGWSPAAAARRGEGVGEGKPNHCWDSVWSLRWSWCWDCCWCCSCCCCCCCCGCSFCYCCRFWRSRRLRLLQRWSSWPSESRNINNFFSHGFESLLQKLTRNFFTESILNERVSQWKLKPDWNAFYDQDLMTATMSTATLTTMTMSTMTTTGMRWRGFWAAKNKYTSNSKRDVAVKSEESLISHFAKDD